MLYGDNLLTPSIGFLKVGVKQLGVILHAFERNNHHRKSIAWRKDQWMLISSITLPKISFSQIGLSSTSSL